MDTSKLSPLAKTIYEQVMASNAGSMGFRTLPIILNETPATAEQITAAVKEINHWDTRRDAVWRVRDECAGRVDVSCKWCVG